MSAGSLKGLGFVKVVSALPIHVGNLDAGATRTIRVVLDVPTVVTPLSLTEVGSFRTPMA
jgi:hypothetical protein